MTVPFGLNNVRKPGRADGKSWHFAGLEPAAVAVRRLVL